MAKERKDVRRLDDRRACPSHCEMVEAVTIISNNLKWHTRIGYGVFTVGLCVVAIGLSALIYFGKIDNQVRVNKDMLLKIEKKLDRHLEAIE